MMRPMIILLTVAVIVLAMVCWHQENLILMTQDHIHNQFVIQEQIDESQTRLIKQALGVDWEEKEHDVLKHAY